MPSLFSLTVFNILAFISWTANPPNVPFIFSSCLQHSSLLLVYRQCNQWPRCFDVLIFFFYHIILKESGLSFYNARYLFSPIVIILQYILTSPFIKMFFINDGITVKRMLVLSASWTCPGENEYHVPITTVIYFMSWNSDNRSGGFVLFSMTL